MEKNFPDREHRDRLAALYEEADAATEIPRLRGLRCPPGCGTCCLGSLPDISLFEALPLASLIHGDTSLADLFEKSLPLPPSPCFFYRADGDGHCGAYALRPLPCRLFGFTGVRGKDGAARFRPCRSMTGGAPASEVPLYQHFAGRLLAVSPPELSTILPFGEALTRVWLQAGIRGHFASLADSPGGEDDTRQPPRPSLPFPRAA